MENKYGLYIAHEGTVVRLPVNPESYSITKDNDNGNYNVLGVGPIMIPRTPKLQTAAWSGLLPGRADLGAVLTAGAFQPPKFYIDFLQAAMDEKWIVRFVANRYMEDGTAIFDTNMEALVTRFKSEERGGETGDFYYDIALSEYRDYSPKTVKLQPSAGAGQPVTATSETTRSILQGQLTVGQAVTVNGDCFYNSYGGEPHATLSGFRGQISRIITTDPQRPYPYHITTESGGAKGWVKASQIQAVS
ncbi:MAG: hypothetical protein HDT16_11770 [Oscillibacter sp.]|nr:hypothetical protein [Oscillibacter sp.]